MTLSSHGGKAKMSTLMIHLRIRLARNGVVADMAPNARRPTLLVVAFLAHSSFFLEKFNGCLQLPFGFLLPGHSSRLVDCRDLV